MEIYDDIYSFKEQIKNINNIIIMSESILLNSSKKVDNNLKLEEFLKKIKKYLIDNLFIINLNTDLNTENLLRYLKNEQINRLILFNNKNLELENELFKYPIKNIIGFGYNAKDLIMLLKINEFGGTSYILDDIYIKKIDLFSLIMRMIDIKYYSELSFFFEKNDKEGYKKLRKKANEEALEIFYNCENCKINKEELLKKIYFYLICDTYNFHAKFENKKEKLNPEEVNKKLGLIYNFDEVYNIINGLSKTL